jgi:hypothetical protein
MKKLLLLIFLIQLGTILKAQGGCTTAIAFPDANSCFISNTITGSEKWFSFVAEDDLELVELKKNASSSSFVNKLELFSGTCGTLVLEKKDTISDPGDTILTFTAKSLTIGNTYYVKITKVSLSNPKVDFCMKSASSGASNHSLFLCASGSVQGAGYNTF